ncbi:hypothetical protein [Mycoplasma elephantis]|uniref:hypothetical protein n=1 Tax=Mycoplasma elephantis TaxID=114882 RepID=UPI00048105A6|nr:hypothetical protein [Mycoplasma elephantis]
MKYSVNSLKNHWLILDNNDLKSEIIELINKNNNEIIDFLKENELKNLFNIKKYNALKWTEINNFLNLTSNFQVNTNNENLNYLTQIGEDIYDFLRKEEINFEKTGNNKIKNIYDTVIYNVNYIPTDDDKEDLYE